MTSQNGIPHISALALDLDGVIFDTADECLRLSYAAFNAVEDCGPHDASALVSLTLPGPLAARFLERRGIVRPAAHYYLLWKWILEFPDRRLDGATFEALAPAYARELEAFRELFFRWRTDFRQRYPREWLRMNPPYPGVRALWPMLWSIPVYVVTTKDRPAVLQLLEANQLPIAGLFAAGDFTEKGEALRAIAAREAVPVAEILFVDDNAGHLADADRSGATLRWAAWGYDAAGAAVAPALKNFEELVALVAGAAVSTPEVSGSEDRDVHE